MEFTYNINGGRYRFKLETSLGEDSSECIAEEAAEDYQENHDGGESSWPVEIRVFKGDELLGKYEVHREYEPIFIANEI